MRRWLPGMVAALVAVMATFVGAPAAQAVQPVRPEQWYLNAWKIEDLWKISQGEGVTVALIDSGANAAHPDLAGQAAEAPSWPGYADNHGTMMASLIAGTGRGINGQGAYGVAPKAKIVSYYAWRAGTGLMDSNKLAPAIRAAADSSAKIINLSYSGGPNAIEDAAVAYALSRGKLVVASGTTNMGFPQTHSYPASIPGVLGVGAYDQTGTAWAETAPGNWVSLAAPGVNIVGACNGPTGYCKGSGTSESAAITSGVAALLWAKYPHYTANQIIRILIDSANKPNVPVPNEYLGYGNVSPRNALNWTGDPGPPDVNPLVGKRGNPPTAAMATPSQPPSQSPSPTPTTSTDPSPQPSMSPVAAPPSDSSDSGSDLPFIIGIIIAGTAVLGGAVFLLTRSRRTHPTPP